MLDCDCTRKNDLKKAREWLTKSAAQGHTVAQTELDILDQLDAQ